VARSFLSLGSINADFQFEVSADLAGGGTLPAKSFVQRAGGKGANRAVFAQRVGVAATLIGRVGEDHFAEQAMAPLRALDLDISGVSTNSCAPTAVSMIAVPDDGEKTILLASNANRDWDAAALALLENIIGNADAQAVLTLDFEVSPEAVDLALEVAAKRGLRVVADGSFGKDVKGEHLRQLYAIAPNVQEAGVIAEMEIASDADAEAAARKLAQGGVDVVCVKLSDGGCLLASGGTIKRIAAPPVSVVDKTGAGDAFTAALAIAVLEGRPALEAAAYGVAASSLAVGKNGSQEAYPTRAELDSMFQKVLGLGSASR